MRRALAMLAVAALPVLPAAAAPARAPGDGPYRVRLISRTGGSLAPFAAEVAWTSDNSYGMAYLIEMYRDEHGRVRVGSTSYFGSAGAPYPIVYGVPTGPVPACPAAPGCAHPVDEEAAIELTFTPRATSRYYLVSTHADVRIALRAKGWSIRDVANPGVRRVLPESTTATGVRTMSVDVEHFTEASARGGRYGSAVFAAVPCLYRGTGSAVLTGRGTVRGPSRLECRLGDRGLLNVRSIAFAWSPVEAQWRLAGDVAGVGAFRDRLFVFDFPRS